MNDVAADARMFIGGAPYAISAPSADLIQRDERSGCTIFTVRPGDQAPYDRQRGRPYERAELINLAALPYGKSALISYFQYIAPGSAASRPAIIGQIHNTAVPGSGPQPFVAMRVNGSTQYVATNSAGGKGASRKTTVRWSAPVVVGRWIHWVWQFRPDRSDTTVQIWRDGVAIFDAPVRLGGYTDPRGPYWQFGIYRSKDTTAMRVAYAAVSVRAGRHREADDGGAPPSCPVAPIDRP